MHALLILDISGVANELEVLDDLLVAPHEFVNGFHVAVARKLYFQVEEAFSSVWRQEAVFLFAFFSFNFSTIEFFPHSFL